MELQPYVDHLRHELAVAAATEGDDARVLTDRLLAHLAAATRLTLLDALSTAADEITRELAPGSVHLRLRGVEPSFVVVDRAEPEPRGAEVAPPAPKVDDSAPARINFRPPEQLKARIEEAAAREGMSVNAWLISVLTNVFTMIDVGAAQPGKGGQSFTGWVG
ncbi:toxin-antitoxin system HicB family antitoxin [Actinokineospora enzanensis]|uniref:toxin-antitoxin system HicB family antitoxin n=1 Tax=Actinokineospora enzanensis TaxID=155975 RepID=UPI00036341A9|nr:toxin-antitoxin system HicB family antitoxin [Actinokineospora enzanensis]